MGIHTKVQNSAGYNHNEREVGRYMVRERTNKPISLTMFRWW